MANFWKSFWALGIFLTPTFAGAQVVVSSDESVTFRFDPEVIAELDATTFTFVVDFIEGIGSGESLTLSLGTSAGSNSYGEFTLTNSLSSARSSWGFGVLREDDGSLINEPRLDRPLYATLEYAGTTLSIEDLEIVALGSTVTVCSGSAASECVGGELLGDLVETPKPSTNVFSMGTLELQASLFDAWQNAYELDEEGNAVNRLKENSEEFEACIADPFCDFEALETERKEAFIDGLQAANDVGYESKELITKTSILPDNILETAVEAPFYIELLYDIGQFFGLIDETEEVPEVIESQVSGETGEFTVNPTFTYYNLSYDVTIEGGSFFEELLGVLFPVDSPLFGQDDDFLVGVGYLESLLSNDDGSMLATINVRQVSTDSIPENPLTPVPVPNTLLFILSGLGVLMGISTRNRVTT